MKNNKKLYFIKCDIGNGPGEILEIYESEKEALENIKKHLDKKIKWKSDKKVADYSNRIIEYTSIFDKENKLSYRNNSYWIEKYTFKELIEEINLDRQIDRQNTRALKLLGAY